MNEPWDITIEEASKRLDRRELRAGELLEAAIARLEDTEPVVHAWASVDIDGARAAAAAADRRREDGDTAGPLDGIPIGIKDIIDTAGWPTEAGSRVFAGNVPSADADVVSQLRRAGAIILGKTVTHEIAYGQGAPPTRSPWDVTRYPGGSSVGSAVAVAAGSALAALGTDTGGSIRNPAAVNGLVGLKPTAGLVSRRGVIPLSDSLDHVGCLAKTVSDCAIVFDAIVDPARAATAGAVPGSAYRAATDCLPALVRIGIDREGWSHLGIDPCVLEAVERAIGTLEALGADIVEIRLPALDDSLVVDMTFCLWEAYARHRELLSERGSDYVQGTRVLLLLGALVPESDYVLVQHARDAIRAEVRAVFERDQLDAVASPTLPWPAPPLEELRTDLTRPGDGWDLTGALRLLCWANVCGLPALSIPCGASPEGGLPLGLQLTARPFREADLLALARSYERATTWHERRAHLATTGGVSSDSRESACVPAP